jgi:RimJ/RimL family protein N-acetyltransferase
MFPYRIKTDRLILEKPEVEPDFVYNLHSICSGESSEKITDLISWSPHSNLDQTKEVVEKWSNEFDTFENLNYKMILKDTGEFIGMGGISTCWSKNYGQLGCWIKPEYWGNGLSGERADALIELAFDYFGLNYLIIRVDEDNEKSISSISKYIDKYNGQRCFKYKENVKGYYRNTVVYCITNIDYRNSENTSEIEELEFFD